ncbi:MAG: S-layer y domain protein [Firmicutes bacterium]|nr:S-layer y domain protein [Bacillota bacterium]
MKKLLVNMLCVGSLALLPQTIFANPFSDVPKDHWAYQDIIQLQKDGIIEGDGLGNYNGDRLLTRYEMATIIAGATAKVDKANEEDQKRIQKLQKEFVADLKNIGVTVEYLKSKIEKFNFEGKIGVNYTNHNVAAETKAQMSTWNNNWNKRVNGLTSASTPPHLLQDKNLALDFKINYRIDDNLTSTVENHWARSYETGDAENIDDLDEHRTFSLNGDYDSYSFKVGRYNRNIGYGLLTDTYLVGAHVEVGDKTKFLLDYGKLRAVKGKAGYTIMNAGLAGQMLYDASTYDAYPAAKDNFANYAAAELVVPVNKIMNLRTAYQQLKYEQAVKANTYVGRDYRFKEFGLDIALNKKLKLEAEMGKSNLSNKNKAHVISLNYGNADVKKAHSYGVWGRYVRLQKNAYIDSTYAFDQILETDGKSVAACKGYEFGASYVPEKNKILTISYIDAKNSADTSQYDKALRASVGFLF